MWRTFCEHWHLFAGTASGYWLTSGLVELFGVDRDPSAENADELFDMITATLTMSMGMMMLPPTVLSLPAKLLFFVMIDGWNLLIGSLVRSVA